MDTTQNNETNKHSPNDCKEKYGKITKRNISRYSDKWENDKRAGQFKKELDRIGIDKEGFLEWVRRGQIYWDGE